MSQSNNDPKADQMGFESSENHKLRRAMSSAGVGIWTYDLVSNRLSWDSQMWKIYGYPTDCSENPYDVWSKSVHPEDRAQEDRTAQEAIAKKGAFYSRFRIIHPDGAVRHIKAMGEVFMDESGNPAEVVGINIDETEHHNRKLELEKQQAISLKQSKFANIGELAAGVGHEVNNPLTIILGKAKKLKQLVQNAGIGDEEALPILEAIEHQVEAATRIRKITDGLRTFARFGMGDEHEYTNLHEAINSTLELIREIYTLEGIKLRYSRPSFTCLVKSSKIQTQQIIMNLISNAKDALVGCKNKEIEIEIVHNDACWTLVVKDNGSGIDPADHNKVFESFFTTKFDNQGTGLGLSICQSFVESIGGKIYFESKVNVGTQFYVDFPKQDPKVAATFDLKSSENQSAADEYQHLAVLVIDDDLDVLEVVSESFLDFGCQVIGERDPLKAISLLQTKRFDLIVCDIQMNEIDGLSLMAKITNSGFNNQAYKYLMTGGTLRDLENLCPDFRIGMIDGLLSKPFTDEDIVKILKVTKANKLKRIK